MFLSLNLRQIQKLKNKLSVRMCGLAYLSLGSRRTSEADL